jgi:hypothetical protein
MSLISNPEKAAFTPVAHHPTGWTRPGPGGGRLTCFLLSDRASFINGRRLDDGAYTGL